MTAPAHGEGPILYKKRSQAKDLNHTTATSYSNHYDRPTDSVFENDTEDEYNSCFPSDAHMTDAHRDAHKRLVTEASSDETVDDSKWIHRDKLAKIESEELQAAGFILSRVKPMKNQAQWRRDDSTDQSSTSSRSHQNTRAVENASLDLTAPSWDPRLPEEIAENYANGYWVTSNGNAKSSRIPVAKVSPVPISPEHIERETRMARKRDSSPGDEESILFPKSRERSASGETNTSTNPSSSSKRGSAPFESPPRKGTAGTRKGSAPRSTNGPRGQVKSRGQVRKDSSSSNGGTRPTTRAGDREMSPSTSNSKQMEGEPPWMVSAYRPDPRLPPEKQLLPTVAKRLQQEKWEREGKFGNIYDKDFRPLTDEGLPSPPPHPQSEEKQERDEDAQSQTEGQEQEQEQGQEQQQKPPPPVRPPTPPQERSKDWPLKPEDKPARRPSSRVGPYSTMPRITDKPGANSLPSPKSPMDMSAQPPTPVTARLTPAERQQGPPEKKEKQGCGCCIVM